MYRLFQTSRTTQILESVPEVSSSRTLPNDSYEIKINAGSSFLSRRADIIINTINNGLLFQIAAANFGKNNPDITIHYLDLKLNQRLVLENARYAITINERAHFWQTVAANDSLQLLNGKDGQLMAKFAFASQLYSQGQSISANSKDLGEFLVNKFYTYDPTELEQIICSAIVLVENSSRVAARGKEANEKA